jgi:hypothetical protein
MIAQRWQATHRSWRATTRSPLCSRAPNGQLTVHRLQWRHASRSMVTLKRLAVLILVSMGFLLPQ